MFNFPCRGGDRKERDGRGAATEPGGDGEDEEKLGAAAQGARGRVPGTVYTACLGLRQIKFIGEGVRILFHLEYFSIY